jgi:methionyl-tRNA formyltransferase
MPADRPLRVVVVAEESAGVQALNALLGAPESPEIVAVVTATEPEERRRPLVAAAATRHGLEILPSSTLGDGSFAETVRKLDVDLLVNVHSLFVLGSDIVCAPRIGSFNLHPGPLPQYAGLNAPSWAIFHGERKHAATVHWMDAGIDTGPIAYAADFEIGEADTGLAVAGRCVRVGVPLLVRVVDQAVVEPAGIPRLAQELSLRRYFGAGAPNGGRIDWTASASEVVRFVRAADYAPFASSWGHPRAELFGRDVGIAKASTTATVAGGAPGAVVEVDDRGALVAARDELVLVERLWLDGRYQQVADVVGNLPSRRLRS